MLHPLRFLTAAGLTLVMAGVGAETTETPAEVQTKEPRSVILIIGDGFDDQHVTMARNYLVGMDGELTLDTLPVRSAVQVQTVGQDTPWQYVADSANTATALASGTATQMGRVGTGPADLDLETIAEQAAAAGFKTGIVSSSSVTDATPASFMAHVANRGCENPETILGGTLYGVEFPGCPQDAVGNGGPGSIAEQIINSPIDVVLGGGQKHFAVSRPGETQTLLDMAAAQGIAVVTDRDNLTSADRQKRLLGLFAPSHLPVRLQGSGGRRAEQPDTSLLNQLDWRLGSVIQPEPMNCEANPDYGLTPSLAMLTEVAIDRLNRDNARGFFLMVESASIDKQAHGRNPCGSIGEVEQLEEVLAIALTHAEIHPETLVIVTADHAQAAQIIPEPSLFAQIPVPIFSPGHVARLTMADGSLMTINYATNTFRAEEHTGANVPLFANQQALGRIPTFLRQREVYDVMVDYLGLTSP